MMRAPLLFATVSVAFAQTFLTTTDWVGYNTGGASFSPTGKVLVSLPVQNTEFSGPANPRLATFTMSMAGLDTRCSVNANAQYQCPNNAATCSQYQGGSSDRPPAQTSCVMAMTAETKCPASLVAGSVSGKFWATTTSQTTPWIDGFGAYKPISGTAGTAGIQFTANAGHSNTNAAGSPATFTTPLEQTDTIDLGLAQLVDFMGKTIMFTDFDGDVIACGVIGATEALAKLGQVPRVNKANCANIDAISKGRAAATPPFDTTSPNIKVHERLNNLRSYPVLNSFNCEKTYKNTFRPSYAADGTYGGVPYRQHLAGFRACDKGANNDNTDNPGKCQETYPPS